MDARSRNSMWEMMKQVCNDFETTIFLTTHYLEEADSLSNNVCIMKNGKAVKQGTQGGIEEHFAAGRNAHPEFGGHYPFA